MFADPTTKDVALTFIHHNIGFIKTLLTRTLRPIPRRQKRSNTLHRSGLSFARTMRLALLAPQSQSLVVVRVCGANEEEGGVVVGCRGTQMTPLFCVPANAIRGM